MYIRKIEGTWFLMDKGEIIESYDYEYQAALALFDKTRGWESLWDMENGKDK